MSQRILSFIGFLLSALTLLLLILAIDFAGVRFLNKNALAFDIHCYSYGLTFFVATATFFLFFRKICRAVLASACAVLCAAVWWVIAFSILVSFHSIIGGTL